MRSLIGRTGFIGKFRLALAALMLAVSVNSIAGVNLKQGKWKDGKIVWYFTGGLVEIAADLTPYNLASDRLLYILVHEIGHLLNLAHSDEPYSVMYANPYVAIQSATEPYKAYADDLSTCANLYGAKGIQPSHDYGADPFVADPRYGLSASVGHTIFNGGATIATGSAQDIWQSVDPNAVDLGQLENSPWLRIAWKQPLASLATVRIIAPSGDIVLDNYTIATKPANILDGYFPFRFGISLNGLWKLQAFVDGSWSSNRAALFAFTAPGVANFDILRDVDTRGLPPGTTLVVGYGASLDDLTANARYKIVRVF